MRTIFLGLAMWARLSLFAQQTPTVTVPFVGCRSDGQVGPLEAPTGKSPSMTLAPETARRLAYYKSEYSFGVLAPRGWHCLDLYGSSGDTLYVSPNFLANRFS